MNTVIRTMNCHTCQSKLVPYLHRQLSPRMQRRVGHHLDTCPVCYAAYLAQRDLSTELTASLTRIGQPSAPQLGRMWAAIQSDIQRPRPVTRRSTGRVGVALLILALALLLPWSLDKQPVARAIPNHPVAPASTADATEPPTLVAMTTPAVTVDSTYAKIPAAETPATPESVRANP
jgi:anti-sigma factor RsiW